MTDGAHARMSRKKKTPATRREPGATPAAAPAPTPSPFGGRARGASSRAGAPPGHGSSRRCARRVAAIGLAWLAQRDRAGAPAPPPQAVGGTCRDVHGRRGVRELPRQGARGVEGLRPRSRDAGRRRQVRARRFRECQVRVRGHDVDVLAPRRQVLRQYRRSGRQARRLRDQVHVRRAPAAAVPDRNARRPPAGARHRVGFAAEGAGRPALVPPVSRAEHQGGRSAALDGRAAELELPVRRMPLDQPAEELRREDGHVRHEMERDRRRVRGVPRPRLEPRRLGEPAGELRGARRDQGPRRGARRAQGRDLDAGRRDRQLEAQRAEARRRARSTPARAAMPARAASPTTTCTASRRRTRTGSRCSRTTSTGTTGRCATRSTTGARSCRAGCTRRASRAPTATTRIRSSFGRRPMPCARSAICRRSSTPRSTRTTPRARPAPPAPRATCRRRPTWEWTRATTTRCAFRVPTSPRRSARRTPAPTATRSKPRSGRPTRYSAGRASLRRATRISAPPSTRDRSARPVRAARCSG